MKAKRTIVKRVSSSKKVSKASNSGIHHEKNARAVVALLVLLLAFAVLIIFAIYQNNIIENNMFRPFMALAVVFMGFLASLLFLVNKPSK